MEVTAALLVSVNPDFPMMRVLNIRVCIFLFKELMMNE